MEVQSVYDRMAADALVAGMRGKFPPAVALETAELLLAHGITIFELTMNSEAPLEAMQALKKRWGDQVVAGMGTVLSPEMARRVLDAGADFVVSPAFQPDVVETVMKAGVLVAPGVITPTEAVTAWSMGVPILKIFPIGSLGVDYFKALFGPLNHMKFMCNGGMDDLNVPDFLKAGAVACGMANWLTGDGTMSHTTMQTRAASLRRAVNAVRRIPHLI